MSSDKERRRFKRYKRKSEATLSVKGNSFKATTLDFSLDGLGFFVENMSSLPEGSAIEIKIEDLNMDIEGKIIWSRKDNSHLRLGIERVSISGHLNQYPLADILLDLQRSRKNGILEIKNAPISKRIYIKNGDSVFATSNHEDDRLGEVLLRAGKITIDQYNQSSDMIKKTGRRQGTILVELGYLKAQELPWAVRHQVEEIILSLFQWEDGEFIFLEGLLPSDEVITLKLSTANLIYRGIKRISSFKYIKNSLPSMDMIPYFSVDPLNLFQHINLDRSDKDILSLIDGKRNIQEILSSSQLDNFQTMKTLYALISTRIIEVAEEELAEAETQEGITRETEMVEDSAFMEKVEDIYKRLKTIDYYNILNIDKRATQDNIKQAFYKVAKEFHPDRHFSLHSETIKDKLNAIFSQITEAYKTLSDLKTRKEYDHRLSTGHTKIENNNIETAKIRFREGKEAFKKGAYTEALELFGQASYLDSSIPDYHFYTGLAFATEKKFHEAEKAFNHALKINPNNTDYMAELGHVYLQLGFNLRAKNTFEKALKSNPANERAAEGLQKLENYS
ncbi:MAG: DUF4388 domain-containing protein [Nitrospirota bacterium]